MAIQKLHDGGPDGVTICGSTTEKLAFYGGPPVAQGAALTAQLTSITIADAVGTPDYAIAAVGNTNAYGFSNAAELITTLYVIQNLQARLAQVEARLEAVGLVAAN
jgi:7,8-dihydro-6-hydroxymethylpterin-pyrophosphokinase